MEAATVAAFASGPVAAALKLADRPEALLDQKPALGDDCQRAVKQLFDLAKQLEPKTFTPLAELLVEGFTLDQIWEQIDLYNAPLLKYSHKGLKKHFADPLAVALPVLESSEDEDEEEEDEDGDGADSDEGGAAAEDDPYAGFRSESDLDDDELAGSSEEDDDPEAAAARLRRKLKAGGESRSKAATERRERKKRHGMENSFFSFDDMEKFMDEAEDEYMAEYEKGDAPDEEGGDDAGWSYQEGDTDDAVPYEDDEGVFEDVKDQDDDEEEGPSSSAMKYQDFFDPPDKLEGSEDVEIGFNPEFEEEDEEEEGKKGKKDSKKEKKSLPNYDVDDEEEVGLDDIAEGIDDEEDEESDDDAEQKMDEFPGEDEDDFEEEEEDEDGVGGFDSMRTDDDFNGQPGSGGASGGGGEEEELDGELGPRSTFERNQLKLKKNIDALESKNIGEKDWETMGEIQGKMRPENSLLGSVLDFQHAGKLKPVVTAESTNTLEELIKQRILDEAYDDVEAKVAIEVKTKKVRSDVSDEKSKDGLGDIYEQDYVKEALGVQPTDKLSEEKQHMAKLFGLLTAKLDALTNFHFAPKPLQEDLQVKSNLPAMAMEEITPVTTSDATLLAPEEVFSKKSAEIVAKSELGKAEKKALRASKKESYKKREAQKDKERQAIIRLVPAAGEKDAKLKAEAQLKGKSKASRGGIEKAKETDGQKFGSSKAFFQTLQDEANTKEGFTNKRKKGRGDDDNKKAKRSHSLKL